MGGQAGGSYYQGIGIGREKMRKIIQIAAACDPGVEDVVFALTDDGMVWSYQWGRAPDVSARWIDLELIPQDEEDK